MPEGGYKIRDQSAIHFITFAVVKWVDVFTRQVYRDILINSLKYCQQEKGLLVHAWRIMSNHVHFILSAENANLSNVLGDFKKFTSKQIIREMIEAIGESRKDLMISLFSEAGQSNSRNKTYLFWQQSNHPMVLFTPKFIAQKTEYIHLNPVKAGIVEKAEEYIYSSARDYYFGRNCGLLPVKFLDLD